MGEIAEMMLDGTMDPETGEFNFEGADGPGWPMTGAEAEAYRRGRYPGRNEPFRAIHEEGALYGFWRLIGDKLREGYGSADAVADALNASEDKVEGHLVTMKKSGLVHRDQGPWKLTKRGKHRLEAGDA